jgi:hypothetical protein
LCDLVKCDPLYTFPHGRPTMIQISHAELEKRFERKVLTSRMRRNGDRRTLTVYDRVQFRLKIFS